MDGTVVQSLPSRQSGQYWDAAATNWEEEIFSSFHNDRKGVILSALKAAADPRAAMADFGCGVGIYLPVLGRLFGAVHGFEQSAACVDVARQKTRGQTNISVHVASSALKKLARPLRCCALRQCRHPSAPRHLAGRARFRPRVAARP